MCWHWNSKQRRRKKITFVVTFLLPTLTLTLLSTDRPPEAGGRRDGPEPEGAGPQDGVSPPGAGGGDLAPQVQQPGRQAQRRGAAAVFQAAHQGRGGWQTALSLE